MKLSRIILIGLPLFYGAGISAAAPGGVVSVINDVPALQFECTYKMGPEILGPIIISPGQMIPLGPVDLISDVIISRYGQVAGIGAKRSLPGKVCNKISSTLKRLWQLML